MLVRREQMQRAFRDDAGRVHLVVHRDPKSGIDRLELSAPLFEESAASERVRTR
jgi:hypothetical protein